MSLLGWELVDVSGSAFKCDTSIVSSSSEHRLRQIISRIDAEIMEHFTGCGSPIPESVTGSRILDLGCGTGRDVFISSALVGPKGFVIGIDNEKESLEVARRHVEATMEKFGYTEPNVAFRKGSIEAMRDAELAEEDYDVVISNRALNLVENRMHALKEIFRVLKTGGEFFFSDVYSDRRIPDEIVNDSELFKKKLGGAMYLNDFLRMVKKSGFIDPRIVKSQPLTVMGHDLTEKLGAIRFYAVSFRLFKIQELEDDEEDYGQAALYLGSIDGVPNSFALDEMNVFERGRVTRIGANTARILQKSRFSPHFKIFGSQHRHFGPFKGQEV